MRFKSRAIEKEVVAMEFIINNSPSHSMVDPILHFNDTFYMATPLDIIKCDSYHWSNCQIRPWGSLYAVAAYIEPASPCHKIPCIPSPGGLSHISYTTSGSYLHWGSHAPPVPYPTDHCRDWVICVPRYRTLGFGSIAPR